MSYVTPRIQALKDIVLDIDYIKYTKEGRSIGYHTETYSHTATMLDSVQSRRFNQDLGLWGVNKTK